MFDPTWFSIREVRNDNRSRRWAVVDRGGVVRASFDVFMDASAWIEERAAKILSAILANVEDEAGKLRVMRAVELVMGPPAAGGHYTAEDFPGFKAGQAAERESGLFYSIRPPAGTIPASPALDAELSSANRKAFLPRVVPYPNCDNEILQALVK